MTEFTYPVTVGGFPNPATSQAFSADTVLCKTVDISFSNLVSGTPLTLFVAPKGIRIFDVKVDTEVAWATVSLATIAIGTSASAARYASGISVATATRAIPTFTSAQCINMGVALTADTTIKASITVCAASAGAITAGNGRVHVFMK